MVNLGHVGAGMWGQNHIRTFLGLNDCHLKLCCDTNRKVLEKLSSFYGQRLNLTDRFRDILDDKDIEGVVISTPAVTHAALTIEALGAGKHVFVEKPLALNTDDAEMMIEAARKNKKILMVGHLLLYHPAVLKLKDYIDKDELGKILYIYSTRVNLGQVREEENALWSLTVHDISVALFLLSDTPEEVSAKGESYLRKGIEDVVFVTMKFKNNILVQIHASWLDPHKIRKFTVVGTKKMVVFDDMETSEKIKIYDKGFDRKLDFNSYAEYLTLRNGDSYMPYLDLKEPLRVECEHFLQCIANNTHPRTDGNNGLEVLKVLKAAQNSLDKGGVPVRLK